MTKYFATLFLSLLLTGCAPNLDFSVKDRWAKSVRNLALQPVYPMREDVFVGTLRIVSSNEDAFSLKSRSLGYVSIHDALAQAERRKPQYPVSGTSNTVSLGSEDKAKLTAWKQPTATNALVPNLSSNPERLRLAAIPGVSLVRVSEADLAKRGLLKVIAAAFRRNSELTINLKGVETLEIDDISAAKALVFGIHSPAVHDPWFGQGVCTAAVALGDPSLDSIQIQMITRVFYARAIEYNYGDDASAALKQVSSKEAVTDTSGNAAPSTTPAGAAVEGDGTKPAEKPAAATVGDVSNVAPGTVAKVAVQRKDGSSLTEVFERPLAFGVGVLAVSPKEIGIKCTPGGLLVAPRAPSNDAGKLGSKPIVFKELPKQQKPDPGPVLTVTPQTCGAVWTGQGYLQTSFGWSEDTGGDRPKIGEP